MHSSMSLSASSDVSSGHAPRDATDVLPSQVAKQSFEYVFPSSPHTGSQSSMHAQSASSDVSSGHAPGDATAMPSQVAKHSFPYVFPSSPHTGS